MLFADRLVLTRLFKGRRGYVVICWVLICAISLGAFVVLTGNVAPLLWALTATAGPVVSSVVFCGIATLAATTVSNGCLRGSVIGLQVMATGLRSLP